MGCESHFTAPVGFLLYTLGYILSVVHHYNAVCIVLSITLLPILYLQNFQDPRFPRTVKTTQAFSLTDQAGRINLRDESARPQFVTIKSSEKFLQTD